MTTTATEEAATVRRRLDQDGYAMGPTVPAATVDALRQLFDEIGVPPEHEHFTSGKCRDREQVPGDPGAAEARAIDLRIKELLVAVGRDLLPGHRPVVAGFISKGRRQSASMGFHQDLTHTDERRFRSTTMWVPLVDIGPDNGALLVVPGSHQWTSSIRACSDEPQPTEPFQDQLGERAMGLECAAGTAIFWDSALVHGSMPNNSGEVRPAAAIVFVPDGAEMVHFHVGESGELVGLRSDEALFTTGAVADPVPVPAWTRKLTSTDLEPLLPPSRMTGSVSRTASPAAQPRRVLVDPKDDRHLRRHGFVVTSIDARQIAPQLREEYGRLHGWSGAGFDADLNNADVAYRDEVHRVLDRALGSLVRERFVGYEPYLYNFLCKWPGDDSDLYLHQDWMFIDERTGERSFVMWIPLQDVVGHNGQLRVLRGSHLLPSRPRGTDLSAPWVDHEDVIRARLRSVPTTVGQAVIFDNRLVHCSYPNHTEVPRVVVAVGMRPAGADLVHFRSLDDEHGVRFAVDEEFFRRYTPAGLTEAPPAIPVAEVFDVIPDDALSPEELAAALDTGAPVGGARSLVGRVRTLLTASRR